MDSPIVTLTTDWGGQDFFAGMVKGRLYSSIPQVRVVDITHGIEPFQLSKAIFVSRHACMHFPARTIHIIDVSAANVDLRPYVAIEYQGQYYLCMDNGLPSALFEGNDYQAVTISNEAFQYAEDDFRNFAAFHILCPVAIALANGARLSDIGAPADPFWRYTPNLPINSGNNIKLYVSYIDHYGNAYLNIKYEDFKQLLGGRNFEMWVREMKLTEVVHSYSHVEHAGGSRDALMLTVSATGYLQLAVRQYSAEQLFGLRVKDSINVMIK